MSSLGLENHTSPQALERFTEVGAEHVTASAAHCKVQRNRNGVVAAHLECRPDPF